MRSLLLLTKKNLKLLVRSKTSALVIFFAPLMIILLLGLSYNNTSKYGLNIGIYAPVFSDDVNSLMVSLQEQEFKIIKYESSVDDCVKDIKEGIVHTCLSVPESLKIDGNQQKEITFYVDPSKINLVWMIQETLGNKFNLKSKEISKELSNNILTTVSDTKTKLDEQNSQLSGVKEKSSAATTSAQTAVQQLTTLDLTVPEATFNPQLITDFKAAVSSNVDNGLSEVDNAIDTVQGANMTGKGAVLDTLGNVKTKLGAINDMLNGGTAIEGGLNQTGSNTTQTISFSAVTAAVTALQQDLDSAKTKLNTASQAVSSTSTSLSDTSQALQQSLTSLEGVQQKLSEMKAALEAQKVTDAGVLSSPLVTKIEEIGPENTYLNYLFPALLVLAVMFSSLLLGTTLVMMEKNSPAFFRNYFLPLRKGTFVISTYLTTVLITLVQIVIILSVSAIFLKENPLNMLPVAGVLLLSSSVFSFIGMGIGYAFKSEETGTLASISTGSLLLFVSGVVMPLEGISAAMRKITTLNPFVISEKVIRELFIFKNSISSVWGSVAILAGYAVALFLVILIAEYLMHKHFISGFMKHRHLHHRQQERRDKNNV